MKILVSACLLGINCKYDGGNNRNDKVLSLLDEHTLIPVCPECLGRLTVPRCPSEIANGRVMNSAGEDVDAQFRKGAAEALRIARENEIDLAILQSRSPSCGIGRIYDGSFSRTLTDGNGIFASLLLENGFKVVDIADF